MKSRLLLLIIVAIITRSVLCEEQTATGSSDGSKGSLQRDDKSEEDKGLTLNQNPSSNTTNEQHQPSKTSDLEKSEVSNNTSDETNILLSEAVSVKVMIGQKNSIAMVDLSTSARQPLILEKDNNDVYSIDFDWGKNLIFFATNNTIYRGSYLSRRRLFELRPIVIEGLNGPIRLAVDWIHDKLYWMCDTSQTIEMVNLDGSNRQLLVDNIKPFKFPNNIVVDPYEGILFFVSDYALFKADLNGKNIKHVGVEQNVRGQVGWGIRTIALDRNHKKVILTGQTRNTVMKNSTVFVVQIDYDGIGDLNNLLAKPEQWTDIFSIDVYKDTLYFVHYNQNDVDRMIAVSLTTKDAVPDLKYVPRSADIGIWSIKVVHPCTQKLHSCEDCGDCSSP